MIINLKQRLLESINTLASTPMNMSLEDWDYISQPFVEAVNYIERMEEALNELAQWYDGEVGFHMDDPWAASVARIALNGVKTK